MAPDAKIYSLNDSSADGLKGANENPDIWTIQKVIQWSSNWLKEKSVDKDLANPRLETELLLAHVLEIDRMKLYMQLEKPLLKAERDTFKGLLKRRVDGEPIAYILGYRDFFRHRFVVSKSVLIPRVDTEILVEKSLDLIKDRPNVKILEVGTGSGCIAISLAMAGPNSQILAIDRSEDAVAVARQNANEIGAKNLNLEVRDVFNSDFPERFDLIVSNPPYIAKAEAVTLSRSVKDFEPEMALFDIADDGLSFYRLLASKAKEWLIPGGSLAVECGHTQASKIINIFEVAGLKEVHSTKDLSGIERVIVGRLDNL